MTLKEPFFIKPHVLIVDDDIRILQLLKRFFLQNDCFVSVATDTEKAEERIKYFIFDLMILDVMIPKITGFEFAKQIKKNKMSLPIILLTALADTENKIYGLESGVDDYMSKPFEPKELLLRAKNLINLYQKIEKQTHQIRFGNNIYNVQTKQLSCDGNNIDLSSSEQKLLQIFINNINKVLTREQIAELMGGLNLRTVDVQITRLRNKLEAYSNRYIQTIRNKGYGLYI